VPYEGVPFVGVDNEAGAREAAGHLVGLGHRRFGVVTFAMAPDMTEGFADEKRQGTVSFPVTRSRLRGYGAEISASGVPWRGVPVYECPTNDRGCARRAGGRLLTRDPRPTAILAISDQLALGVLDAARDLGLSVPADLSVVGFDDVPEAARSAPPLTTVAQPHFEKGLEAGRILVSALREEGPPEPGPSEQRLLPTRLVVRGSTAQAKGI
jgi:DNA-binding LacI/PurR family transcriptional regulator